MKKALIWFGILLVIIGSVWYLYWENDTLGVTNYTVENSKIPEAFDGYKIILLADIQGSSFGENNNETIRLIEEQNADMVVFGGDQIDTGVPGSIELIENLLKECSLPKQVYAISGNHDKWSGRFEELKEKWEKNYNIVFLENKTVSIERDGEEILLSGIADPDTWENAEAETFVKKALKEVKESEEEKGYRILLFHRANMLDLFNQESYDLILSGHMHGGQVRIPFLGGLKSPHGDWFPKYSGGRYEVNDHTYIVSRGIGNAVSLPRVLNRGEIVTVTLRRE